MTKNNTRTAGIDTSKAKLDIAIHGGECWQVTNVASGWRSVMQKAIHCNMKRGEARVIRAILPADRVGIRGVFTVGRPQ